MEFKCKQQPLTLDQEIITLYKNTKTRTITRANINKPKKKKKIHQILTEQVNNAEILNSGDSPYCTNWGTHRCLN